VIPHLRIARPVSDLGRAAALYAGGLGWIELGRFGDHAGFDGVMLGLPDAGFHLELTRRRGHPVVPRPTAEDLLVLYVPDATAWAARCAAMADAGFAPVTAFNPYWEQRGRSFEDFDGYRVVIQRDAWRPDREAVSTRAAPA